MNKFPAHRLKNMALHWLREQYPNALLIPELAVAKYGNAMIDVAVILPTGIIGLEIKGDGDSPSRLERQGWVYSRTASSMWLLASPSLEKAASKHRPSGWGRLVVNGGALKIRTNIWPAVPLPNAPASLLDILWKPELVKVAVALRVSYDKSAAVHKIAHAVAEVARLKDIREHVCKALIDRDWNNFPRPGMEKTVYRPGDALPEITVAGDQT